jgi:pSer/pThr/pTyr-binding forkhead associated (FHA) protein
MTDLKRSIPSGSPPRLKLSVAALEGERRDFVFDRPFRIGRIDECDVCIQNEYVSRNHAEVAF